MCLQTRDMYKFVCTLNLIATSFTMLNQDVLETPACDIKLLSTDKFVDNFSVIVKGSLSVLCAQDGKHKGRMKHTTTTTIGKRVPVYPGTN